MVEILLVTSCQKKQNEGWPFGSLGLNTDFNNVSNYVYMYNWIYENGVNEKIILLYKRATDWDFTTSKGPKINLSNEKSARVQKGR